MLPVARNRGQKEHDVTTIYSFSITAPGGGIGYTGNGDVRYVNDNINGNWTYAYDDLNRLLTSACAATCPNGLSAQSFTYDYDRFGNRWHQNAPQGGPAPQYSFDVNNRISGSGMTYDAAGNITNDSFHTYTYDGENRITQVDAGATGTYVYDAAGQRARKTTASATVDYLYDLSGHLITEIDSSGAWTRGEVYAGGRHVATYSGGVNGITYFSHVDWLGTERARTRAIGTVSETCVSFVFGDGQACAGSGDPSPLHFTGKMRDTESNLDYFGARHYGSTMGRFMAPDDVRNDSHPLDPQSWDEYVYVRDNPLRYVDPTGEASMSDSCYATGTGCGTKGPSMEQGTQGPPQAQNQKPTGLIAVKVEIIDTGSAYGIKLQVTYQVVNQEGNAVTGDGTKMEPQERVSGQFNGQPIQMIGGTGWADIGPSTVRGTSKYADANGQFVDAPLGITARGPFRSVSNQEIRIKIGKETFPVRFNRIVIGSDSLGHGTFSNQAGWVGGDLNAEH